MSPDQFKKQCKALGVTVRWLSEELKVPLAVAQKWLEGREQAPTAAIRRLRRLDNFVGEKSNRTVEMVLEAGAPHILWMLCFPTDDLLWESHPQLGNLPAAAHRAYVKRVAMKLKPVGTEVVQVEFDKDHYLRWLGDREVSEATRVEWTLAQGKAHSGKEKDASRRRSPPAQASRPRKKNWKLKVKKGLAEIFAMMEPISGAEYKALRTSLGLTVECAAFMADVSVDTVKEWESGEADPDNGGGLILRKMNELLDEMAGDYLKIIKEVAKSEGVDLKNVEHLLAMYSSDHDFRVFRPDMAPLPANSYNSVTKRALKKLRDAGCDVKTVMIEHEEYKKWLGPKRDTQDSRDAWHQMKLKHYGLDAQRSVIELSKEEFQARRESLGLSVEDFTRFYSVEPSVVVEWESGKIVIPDVAKELLFQMEEKLNAELEAIRENWREYKNEGGAAQFFPVPRFRSDEDFWEYYPSEVPFPVGFYNVMLVGIEKILLEAGVLPVVFTYDREQYLGWLGNRKDSERLRAEWNDLQIPMVPSGSKN